MIENDGLALASCIFALALKSLRVHDALDGKSWKARSFTILLIFTPQVSTNTAISLGISGALITEHPRPRSYINEEQLN